MNRILALTICLLPLGIQAQEAVKEVTSSIKEVKVFGYGAQVKRSADVKLEKGINKLVFTGITRQLDPASIQVDVPSHIVILSVSHRESIIKNPKKAPIIHMLEDSVRILEHDLEEEKNNRFVLEQLEDVLMKNKELKGDKGLNLIDLEDVLELYRKQLTATRKGLLQSKQNEKRLNERLYVLRSQLEEFRKSNQQPVYEIIVTVSTASAGNETVGFGYFTNGASWSPFYDIRAKGTSDPVALSYKAEVLNNTGENWNNVDMLLSTGNPNLRGNPPVMNPQYLYFKEPEVQKEIFRKKHADQAPPAYNFDFGDQQLQLNEVVVVENTTTVEFKIPVPVNVAANNQPQLLDIATYSLQAAFKHFTVPRLDHSSFLVAGVTGWEKYNLLPGKANIYFEGSFVGTSDIDPRVTTDTLRLSLGRDNRVAVTRENTKRYCNRNLTGSKVKEELVFEITVRNNKSVPVTIEILDQVPLSSNKEISVDVKEVSGAEWNESTGELRWVKTIAPGQTEKITIAFDVKYPKDKILSGL